jgi:predicted nuclease of restriction endonuclease-like (RecB) superfamily
MSEIPARLQVAPEGYAEWLTDLKGRIHTAQQRATLAVNRELVLLYWQIGRDILERQAAQGWGSKVVDRLAADLRIAFPEMKGFSPRNLKYMRAFAEAWPDEPIVQQVVAQLPWGHCLVLLDRLKTREERVAYAQAAIQHGWSRNVLDHQIEGRRLERTGKAVSNFETTLPKPESDLARESLKDPYRFDFLNLTDEAQEREIEGALVKHVTSFLLELGAGFAFVGRQVVLDVGGDEFKIDLLFYHLKLRCYVVIELKAGKFKPEHLGQLGFYLTAMDRQVKHPQDGPTIGLLLCKSQRTGHAPHAGARLREARRAVPADQVAPASGKSRALMFIALDKLQNQGSSRRSSWCRKSPSASSFNDEPLSKFGFWADWTVEPKWNLCNAPGGGRRQGQCSVAPRSSNSDDKVLVCTHATFRFAWTVRRRGLRRPPDRRGRVPPRFGQPGQRWAPTWRVHRARQGAHRRDDRLLFPRRCRGGAAPGGRGEVRDRHLHLLRAAQRLRAPEAARHRLFLLRGSYIDDIHEGAGPGREDHPAHPERQFAREHQGQARRSRTSSRRWATGRAPIPRPGFQLVKRADGRVLRKIADLVDDDGPKRDRVSAALKDPAQKNNRDHVDIIIALGMAKEGFDWIWCEHALTVGLPVQPDRDRPDHRPRHPRCAGQDPRPLHQPDRRAGCLRSRP